MQDQTKKDAERQAALDYHEFPRPGKLEIRPTKPMATARDLARAYSPGVAEACTEIAADPSKATRYTAKRNLVAVISNGTAVLGLGNIGAQASKPVMEGKAVLATNKVRSSICYRGIMQSRCDRDSAYKRHAVLSLVCKRIFRTAPDVPPRKPQRGSIKPRGRAEDHFEG